LQAYGESYKSGNWVVVIIAVTTVFSGISIHLGTFLMASGRMWLGLKLNIVWSVIFLILSYNMVMWGASGLAGARLLAYIIHFFISLIIARKIKKTYS
jgi:O-antigen/teichoic acid export membrane protein